MKTTGRIIVLAAILLALAFSGAYAQTPVEILAGDLSDFIERAGREITPHMQSSAITSLEAGSAEIGSFPSMYFSLGLGAMFTDGISDVVDAEYTIDVEGILEDEAGDNDTYDMVRDFLPLPVVRLTYGIGLLQGYEANFQLMTIPSALTDATGVEGVSFGLTNVGGRVRKTLISDGPQTPAVSVGVGYVYSSFNMGYDLKELDPIDVGRPQIALDAGEITYELKTNSLGVDVRLSERVGPIIPYIGVSSWYQWSSYEGGVDGMTGTVITEGEEPSDFAPVNELRDFKDNDLNTIVSAGVDLKLGFFVYFLEGSYA
ncbi:MAG: hypothetical protein ACLFPW_13410, partial [Spirochaetaceae bacterium]